MIRMFLPLITFLAGTSPLVSTGPVLSECANNELLMLSMDAFYTGFTLSPNSFASWNSRTFWNNCSVATALEKFKEANFTTAGVLLAQIPIEQFNTIQKDESTHSIALQAAIKSAGSSPFTSRQFNFDAALTDIPMMAATACVVENVGVGAYLGALHLVSDPVLLSTAGSILTVEARHQTEHSCDLGVKPNPTLSITNSGTVDPGTMLNFKSSALTGSRNTLFCQMMLGGNATVIALLLSQCVVPQGINGPVAIFITSDGTPLADVVNRASDKLAPQLLSQLALGGKNNTISGSGGYTQSISPSAASSGSARSYGGS
ncbi:Ferritin-like domain containing protein [Amanita muscaria]